jgi:glycosyltransferase involved in cell wall biosynthesis
MSTRTNMRISVIVPSFNQGDFLEQTLESIFMQSGAELELLVFDGGSTDQTVEILRRHERRLSYWESEPDRGQTHAINKGLARMSGDAWVYLNSDDLLAPSAIATVSRIFADRSVTWVSGLCENFDESGLIGGVLPGPVGRMKDYIAPWNRSSPHVFPFSGACYMRREVFDKIGFFDESYNYSMDCEYYCRAIFEGRFRQTVISQALAKWRWHSTSKTMRQGIAYAFRHDEVRIAQQYGVYLSRAEQVELESEIREQMKWLPLREAMWLLNQGRRKEASALIIEAVRSSPTLLFSRPWLGALRRVWIG